MSNELGNTTLESLGILTGIEGLRVAMTEPTLWHARDTNGIWRESRGEHGWASWSLTKCSLNVTQWQRKPVEKREPRRLEFTEVFGVKSDGYGICEAGIDLDDERNAESGISLSAYWVGKRARITVGEIVDNPSASPADAPGTFITWQRAQERVDAGLAVDASQRDPLSTATDRHWAELGNAIAPREFQHWTYRIPLQPAEPVTTVAKAASDEWIKELERELSESRAASKGLEKACDGLRRELASAFGSQTTAVAALEVERKKNRELLGLLEGISASVDRKLFETAVKGAVSDD